MTNVVTISHDPFARTSLVRRVVGDGRGVCRECGNTNAHGKLFEYGTERDDRGGVDWHTGEFCSIGCHNVYHS